MDATLLGTGSATGVPAALCDCEYCRESDPRNRSSLLVESDGATVVFDAGPDLKRGLRDTGTTAVDAFFLTHFHQDHADGLLDLLQAVKSGATNAVPEGTGPWADDPEHVFDLYMTDTAVEHLRDTHGYFLDLLAPESPAGGVRVGDLTVTPFPVDHWRPLYETVGFLVEGPDGALAYAPDMAGFVDGPPAADLDLLVCEGSSLLGPGGHGTPDALREAIEAADADRTVLVNANEHSARCHTGELRADAADAGCELGADYDTYEV